MAIPIAIAASGSRSALARALRHAGFVPEDPTDLREWLDTAGARAVLIPLRSPADFERLRSIRAVYPGVVAVAELAFVSSDSFREAIRAGAGGVVYGGARPEEVASIIHAAMNQQILVPLSLLGALLSS
jgi:DNA-binding NarL/FixJ family response regulator